MFIMLMDDRVQRLNKKDRKKIYKTVERAKEKIKFICIRLVNSFKITS